MRRLSEKYRFGKFFGIGKSERWKRKKSCNPIMVRSKTFSLPFLIKKFGKSGLSFISISCEGIHLRSSTHRSKSISAEKTIWARLYQLWRSLRKESLPIQRKGSQTERSGNRKGRTVTKNQIFQISTQQPEVELQLQTLDSLPIQKMANNDLLNKISPL